MKHEDYTILIVEDSRTQAAYLQDILESEHYNTQLAINGEEALKSINQNRPDIVLSDVVMPVMDGFDFCKNVKKEKKFSDIPVILLTSLTEPKDIIKGLESGADNFIPKPFTDEYLLSQIESILLNLKLVEEPSTTAGMDVYFKGEKHHIASEKRQIINIFFSTYDHVINKSNDLTKAHHELSRLNNDLERKKQELEKLNEEKVHFLGIAAHDLRNPLSCIIGFVDLIKESMNPQTDSENLQFLGIIDEAGNKMLKLITDLMDISQLESGTLVPNKELVNITELFLRNIETNQHLASNKNIQIQFKHPETDVFCHVDLSKMEQVMNNLLTNAIKFSHTQTTIVVTLENRGDDIYFCVEDHGQGIPEKEHKALFKPFSTTSVKATKGEPSTGLGLFSVKKIIEAHQGVIKVSSVVNEGTKFFITIPHSSGAGKGPAPATRL